MNPRTVASVMVVVLWAYAPVASAEHGGVASDASASARVPEGLSPSDWSSIRAAYEASQQAYLKASNTGSGDQFGQAVAMSGDTVVVGAFAEDSHATGVDGDPSNNDAASAGAAYVFVRNGSTWSQEAYLKASNTGAGDLFGYSVAVSGDTIVVGAFMEDSSATGVNGDQGNNNAQGSGAAYVFVRDGSTWSQEAYLKASNTDLGDWFGESVAVSGDTVVVGAYREASNAKGVNGDQSNNDTWSSGAVYVFVRNGSTWSQQAYLKASNTELHDEFGYTVALSGDTLVVGAPDEDSSATGVNGDQNHNTAQSSGAAFVFVRSGTTWSQQAYLKASNTATNDFFGIAVAVSGDTAVVGAYEEDSGATGVNGAQGNNDAPDSGAAYVFVHNGLTWSQEAYLKASNTEAGDTFGFSVALSGDTLVVGAIAEDSSATGVNGEESNNDDGDSGAAYVFIRDGSTWSPHAYLKASNTDASDHFGESVAVTGETVMVGGRFEDSSATGVNGEESNNGAGDSGAGYVFFAGLGSGRVGSLMLGKASGDDLVLTWDPSCAADDDDYAVYEGTLGGIFTTHMPVLCGTLGAPTATIPSPSGSAYYLVVPQRNGMHEGSYGLGSGGERPPSAAPCLPQQLGSCP